MKSARLTVFLAMAAALAGCNGSRQAVGTVNSVIVITTDSVWAAVGDSILAALEPRTFTVRDERTFEITQVSPQDPLWTELRRFRQVLVIGTAEDGWVAPAVRRADGDAARGVVQARNVWARNQLVTAVLVPPGSGPDAAVPLLPVAAQVIDSVFRVSARQRMYTSRPDSVLRDSLLAHEGFGILLPNVYRQLTRDHRVSLFQNSTTIGGDLVRSVLVTWRDGLQEATPEAALAWRDEIAGAEYRPPQQTQRDRIESHSMSVAGAPAAEIQGIWDGTDPGWPMSGPFVARMIQCPALDRTYLVDAWLYSPGRAKYEYMIQLQTILNTFECADAR
ncbi:MAG TPA: DUF4837 family protein [Longimicrobiales bacterium]|nr:DUF4837 family protein [Longimicrobiales bacterium]